MNQLRNKRILLGITGAIAAYKSLDLVRRLREAQAEVRVVMTEAAKLFVTPLSFQAVSGNPVSDDLFDVNAEAAMGHIELARWADAIVIAPASADFIAQLAHGHARDLLSTLCLASKNPIAIAPSMNQQMWHAKVTQENLRLLAELGMQIFGPAFGSQACGDVGLGRMLEPLELAENIASLFVSEILSGVRVLLTAGPTREAIDPVRYISNHSSGKMGYALARAAIAAGASVTVVSGPVALSKVERVKQHDVISAQEMHQAVLDEVDECDIFIAAAAVADYRCLKPATQKLHKNAAEMELKLIRNPDILSEVAIRKTKPFTVGFAAETEDVVMRAKEKLQAKNIDMIVANQVGIPEAGFDSDENTCTVFWARGEKEFPLLHKERLARELITLIAERYYDSKKNKT